MNTATDIYERCTTMCMPYIAAHSSTPGSCPAAPSTGILRMEKCTPWFLLQQLDILSTCAYVCVCGVHHVHMTCTQKVWCWDKGNVYNFDGNALSKMGGSGKIGFVFPMKAIPAIAVSLVWIKEVFHTKPNCKASSIV